MVSFGSLSDIVPIEIQDVAFFPIAGVEVPAVLRIGDNALRHPAYEHILPEQTHGFRVQPLL